MEMGNSEYCVYIGGDVLYFLRMYVYRRVLAVGNAINFYILLHIYIYKFI